ncbi:hypothetical protein HXX76_008178 [Chlamydomonas incerta]|uniref:BAHD acyltransferase n=1 Tax=Chlamydomonas incerta TaxID=51695 RepID=A0A835T924_CHLIN|nr:hypothetical protein HXX76_008178 [Chlamydomonas incerta]|eukprot:KAG2433821.1 hypothetical protein HXX76_008178 [Chlamydomonas incerta]
MSVVGQFSGGIVMRHTINTPALKAALADVLAVLPFFAGRAYFADDGSLDVSYPLPGPPSSSAELGNSANVPAGPVYGARFAAASTSASLSDVMAALEGDGGRARVLQSPWGLVPGLMPPHDLDALVQGQWPLAGGLVLHLRGGGAVLWVGAHHGLADFESLQVLAGHWAAAYNARVVDGQTGGRGSSGSGAAAAAGARAGAGAGPVQDALGAGPRSYLELLPEQLRQPFMDGEAVDALADWAPPAAGLPPRREVVAGGRWSGLGVVGKALWHMVWRGGGVSARCLRVSGSRLAELKAQATRELAAARAAAGPAAGPAAAGPAAAGTAAAGPAAAGASREAEADDKPVEWVSTNDALVARLMQVLHSRVPLRRRHPVSCFMAADMRRRQEPTGERVQLPAAQVGNLTYSARLENLRPADMSLGALAAAMRRELLYHLWPQFRGCLARTAAALAAVGPKRLVWGFCAERDLHENIFAPEGPINLTNWDVDYSLWQFGPSPPLAFIPPSAELGPSVICVVPEPPPESLQHPQQQSQGQQGQGKGSAGRGVVLMLSMHNAAWRQLDAAGVDLATAI